MSRRSVERPVVGRSGGIEHLVLEVLAYAVDEAVEGTARDIEVSIRRDGSIVVSDDGRGTDARRDDYGVWQIERGMPTEPSTVLQSPPDRCGTTVRFLPDPEVFGSATVDSRVLAPLLRDISTPARVVLTRD